MVKSVTSCTRAWGERACGGILPTTDAPDGGLRITTYNPDFQRQMALAEQIMHDDREILRALANPGPGSGLIWPTPFTKVYWRDLVDRTVHVTETRRNRRWHIAGGRCLQPNSQIAWRQMLIA